MKRGLLVFMMLTMGLSAQAMVCTSKTDTSKKLFLNEVDGQQLNDILVEGHLITNSIDHIFVGLKHIGFKKNTYMLFDQKGEQFEFLTINSILSSGGHCRARVCPNYPDMDLSTEKTGKLKLSEDDYEYFTCL